MLTERLNQRTTRQSKKAYLIPLTNTGIETFELNHYLFVGREPDNQLILADPIVSRRHAKMEFNNKGLLLRDLESANGTYVNGTKIREVYLNEGDKIRFGSREFMFSFKIPAAQTDQNRFTSKNKAMQEIYNSLPGIAATDLPVLLLGESGVGKEVFAQLIHQNSLRKNGPFISINCSALSPSMIESELFGHIKGSFTDAHQNRKGAFEMARGGTLVLDEVGDLPLDLQPKLLRALENREIRPIGADYTILTDVRIIASTHKSLKQMVLQETFRSDLFFRLNVLQLKIPALRERKEDFERLLYDFAREMRVAFSFNTIKELKRHNWPGNIRELKNFVARASAKFKGKTVDLCDLDDIMETLDPISIPKTVNGLPLFKEIELELIKASLRRNRGNQRQTAIDLGMPRSTLNDKLKKFKINIKDYRG